MHDIPNRIADVPLDVEAIPHASGRWDACRPPEGALLSSEPFCIDTLSFEQWLQWILLPRMKRILAFKKTAACKKRHFCLCAGAAWQGRGTCPQSAVSDKAG